MAKAPGSISQSSSVWCPARESPTSNPPIPAKSPASRIHGWYSSGPLNPGLGLRSSPSTSGGVELRHYLPGASEEEPTHLVCLDVRWNLAPRARASLRPPRCRARAVRALLTYHRVLDVPGL